MDVDKDHRLSLREFERGAYQTYKTYKEFETGGKDVPSLVEIFTFLDADKDKYKNFKTEHIIQFPVSLSMS